MYTDESPIAAVAAYDVTDGVLTHHVAARVVDDGAMTIFHVRNARGIDATLALPVRWIGAPACRAAPH